MPNCDDRYANVHFFVFLFCGSMIDLIGPVEVVI